MENEEKLSPENEAHNIFVRMSMVAYDKAVQKLPPSEYEKVKPFIDGISHSIQDNLQALLRNPVGLRSETISHLKTFLKKH